MQKVSRFGVSMEEELLGLFDRYIEAGGYRNRSEALRDLIRDAFVRQEWKKNKRVAGAILLCFDHHKRDLVDKLLNIQHDYQEHIISTQHVHLDHDNCLEIIVIKGRALVIQKLYGSLKSLKGVKHVALSTTTTGEKII
jgi:CopG family nickel-responsive transcriptional regulator